MYGVVDRHPMHRQEIINPYGPQAQEFYDGYQDEPSPFEHLPYIAAACLFFWIVFGICSFIMGVKIMKKILEFVKLYRKELIAAAVKANQLQQQVTPTQTNNTVVTVEACVDASKDGD